MDQVLNSLKSLKSLLVVFIAVLLLSFHFFFVYFINSTYLSTYVGEDAVGYLYSIGALINIILFLRMPRFLQRKGNFKLILYFTLIELLTVLGLATATWTPLVIFFFIIHTAIPAIILYCLDIFLVHDASRDTMGSIRGIYLTMTNIPPVITPFIVGLILTKPEYWKIYLTSAAFLIPFLILITSYFRKFTDPVYPSVDSKEVISSFYHNKNLFDIFLDNFLLHLFYGWMVIYMPIYLVDHIGFSWAEVGVMFSIMLLPFILFQIPLGRIEDARHDEKQILITGFLIIVISVASIPFIKEANFFLWTSILFLSRVGASMVEVSCESYFFKHVSADNAAYISFFRMTRALPFLISPAIVGLSFILFDFPHSFLVLSVIMLLGIRYAFQISDR